MRQRYDYIQYVYISFTGAALRLGLLHDSMQCIRVSISREPLLERPSNYIGKYICSRKQIQMMNCVFDGLLFSQSSSKVLIYGIIQGACFYGSQPVQLSEVPPYQMSLN